MMLMMLVVAEMARAVSRCYMVFLRPDGISCFGSKVKVDVLLLWHTALYWTENNCNSVHSTINLKCTVSLLKTSAAQSNALQDRRVVQLSRTSCNTVQISNAVQYNTALQPSRTQCNTVQISNAGVQLQCKAIHWTLQHESQMQHCSAAQKKSLQYCELQISNTSQSL